MLYENSNAVRVGVVMMGCCVSHSCNFPDLIIYSFYYLFEVLIELKVILVK